MEYVRPQTDKKFTQAERHHSVGAWQLILADGSRYGSRPESYKVDICKNCRNFENYRCKLSYHTTALTKACKKAVPKRRPRL